MDTFGDRLREAREARGVPLEAVASATRIAAHYLDALERSDLEALPGGPFGKGYIWAYAQFLGIDPQPILEGYRVEERRRGRGTPESEQRMLQELSRLIDQRTEQRTRGSLFSSRAILFPLTFLVLGLVAAGGWLLLQKTAGVDVRASKTTTSFESWSHAGAAPKGPAAPPEVPGSTVSAEKGAAEGHATARVETEVHIAPQRDRESSRTGSVEPRISEVPAAELRSTAASDRIGIAVSESGVGTVVVGRALLGRSNRFPEGARVWFWTRVVGGEPGDVVRHIWLREGRTVARSELTVGGPHWRTQSRYTLEAGSAGSWAVEARDAAGRLLVREEFLCLAAQKNQSRR